MSESSHTVSWLWTLVFWLFVVIKMMGTALASWSWWWLFLPIVPVLSLVVKHFGL